MFEKNLRHACEAMGSASKVDMVELRKGAELIRSKIPHNAAFEAMEQLIKALDDFKMAMPTEEEWLDSDRRMNLVANALAASPKNIH